MSRRLQGSFVVVGYMLLFVVLILYLSVQFLHFSPGQEEGNVPYVENAGFGKYSANPTVIANTVTSWLASPEKLEDMKDAALVAARPSATLDIARDLASIVFATKKTAVAA